MARKNGKNKRPNEGVRVLTDAAERDGGAGRCPAMKRKRYERQMRVGPREVTLPKRQRPGGYVPPDLPVRYIPEPF